MHIIETCLKLIFKLPSGKAKKKNGRWKSKAKINEIEENQQSK